jgi:hypothetical protein
VRWKTIDRKKKATKMISSPNLVLMGTSTPLLDLPYLCFYWFSLMLHKIKSYWNKIQQILWNDT